MAADFLLLQQHRADLEGASVEPVRNRPASKTLGGSQWRESPSQAIFTGASEGGPVGMVGFFLSDPVFLQLPRGSCLGARQSNSRDQASLVGNVWEALCHIPRLW